VFNGVWAVMVSNWSQLSMGASPPELLCPHLLFCPKRAADPSKTRPVRIPYTYNVHRFNSS
jgi:hypothetical protein